jgi:hypothetical protein
MHDDGWAFHNGRAQFDRDSEQRRRLAALDFIQLPLTNEMLKTGAWLDDLEKALRVRDPQLTLFT